MQQLKGARSPSLWLWVALLLSLLFLFTETTQGTDTVDYVVLLRSLALDQDLFLGNDLTIAGKPIIVTDTGYPLNIANLGVAFFWMPFYLLGLLVTWLLSLALPLPPLTGFELFLIFWLKLADWVYGLLALAFTALALRHLMPRDTARLATLLVALGSPFVYYMGPLTPSSHIVSACLSSLFLYGFLRARESRALAPWLALGVVGGLALTVANTNLGLAALPLLHLLHPRRLREQGPAALGAALAALLAYLPQLLVAWLFLGSPLRSPYRVYLNWGEPRLAETLFSSYHGLYFYAPLLLLATLGLVLLVRREPRLALGSLLFVALVAYLNSVNVAWWSGGSFGARHFLTATPLFALGLAALLEALPRYRRALVAGSLLCALWTALLYLPYATDRAILMDYYPPGEQLRLMGEALLNIGPLLRAAALSLLGLPLFLLLVARVWRGRAWPARLADVLFARPVALLLPLLLVAFMGLVLARSQSAKLACHATACDQGWARGDVDQQEFAYIYLERARYHAKRGDRAAAIADMQTAIAAYPNDPALHRILTEFQQ